MFSIIIPWRYSAAREPLFRNVLKCINSQTYADNFEVIVVEQTTKEDSFKNRTKTFDLTSLFSDKISKNYIQGVAEFPQFNKSWLMNLGVMDALHDYVIFMDADTMFGSNFLESIKDYIKHHDESRKKIFFCWTTLIALAGKDNPNQRTIRPENTVAMGGIWCAQKKFYVQELKGMNESYFGYGGEDNDAYDRATYLLNCPICSFMLHYELTHQYHDWEKPAENASKFSSNARVHPKIIHERLSQIKFGNPAGPTVIDMEVKENE